MKQASRQRPRKNKNPKEKIASGRKILMSACTRKPRLVLMERTQQPVLPLLYDPKLCGHFDTSCQCLETISVGDKNSWCYMSLASRMTQNGPKARNRAWSNHEFARSECAGREEHGAGSLWARVQSVSGGCWFWSERGVVLVGARCSYAWGKVRLWSERRVVMVGGTCPSGRSEVWFSLEVADFWLERATTYLRESSR